jgi:hypothetical protein
VAALVARRHRAGSFAGLTLSPGRSLIISEEHADHWRRRSAHLNFGDHVGWFCRPFRGRPSPGQWDFFVEHLAQLHARLGVDLVVVDPLAAFMAGGSENEAGCMLDTLLPLQRLTSAGMSVLVLHHPRRQPAAPGEAARGSGALPGFADILVEMRWLHGPAQDDRRRRLVALARYPETPKELVIALNPDGTDYEALGSMKDAEFAEHWPILERILLEAPALLDRAAIRRAWPARRPEAARLAAWLEEAVTRGLIRRWGKGVKGSRYRYWLPCREEAWLQDPLARIRTPELFYPDGYSVPLGMDKQTAFS